MNIENQNTPTYKYRLYDFSRPHGHEATPKIVELTTRESQAKNAGFAMNHIQKKYIKEQ